MVHSLVVTVVFITDRLMLGHYSEDALGSMQMSGPFLWSLYTVLGAFTVGILAVVGRAVGADDARRAATTTATSLLFAVAVGIVVMVIGLSVREALTVAMSDPASTDPLLLTMAQDYMFYYLLSAPLHMVGLSGTVALQASGDTRTPMLLSVITGVVNVAANWALIFGHLGLPELGAAGAGMASSISLALSGLLTLGILRRTQRPVRLSPIPELDWRPIRSVLRISVPALGERLIFHTAFVIFAGYVGHLGELAMTANQALIAIESVGFMVASGFGVAAGALVAQKMGQDSPELAATSGWIATGLGAVTLSLVSIVFWLIPEQLLGLFCESSEVIELGVECLLIAAWAQPLMAMSDSLSGALRGAGDTKTPMWIAFIGPMVIRLTMCWWLAFELEWGLLGIWVGTTIDWAARTILLFLAFWRGRWRQISLT